MGTEDESNQNLDASLRALESLDKKVIKEIRVKLSSSLVNSFPRVYLWIIFCIQNANHTKINIISSKAMFIRIFTNIDSNVLVSYLKYLVEYKFIFV